MPNRIQKKKIVYKKGNNYKNYKMKKIVDKTRKHNIETLKNSIENMKR